MERPPSRPRPHRQQARWDAGARPDPGRRRLPSAGQRVAV